MKIMETPVSSAFSLGLRNESEDSCTSQKSDLLQHRSQSFPSRARRHKLSSWHVSCTNLFINYPFMSQAKSSHTAFTELHASIRLEEPILDLVRTRTAEIHGFTVLTLWSGQAEDALSTGIREDLDEKEAMALSLTDAISLPSVDSFLEMMLQQAQEHFTRGEVVCLVMSVLAANDFYYQMGLHGPAPCLPGF
jgi:hypothetical protein